MIQVIEGNLLESNVDIIVHQVNCKGVMGAGIAKQIREKFPNTYATYKALCDRKTADELLGRLVYTPETLNGKPVIIANLFAQDGYGTDRQHTDYEALVSCLARLSFTGNLFKKLGLPHKIGLPYKIGCGLGGGDWGHVSKLIRRHLSDQDVDIYKLPAR